MPTVAFRPLLRFDKRRVGTSNRCMAEQFGLFDARSLQPATARDGESAGRGGAAPGRTPRRCRCVFARAVAHGGSHCGCCRRIRSSSSCRAVRAQPMSPRSCTRTAAGSSARGARSLLTMRWRKTGCPRKSRCAQSIRAGSCAMRPQPQAQSRVRMLDDVLEVRTRDAEHLGAADALCAHGSAIRRAIT